MEKEVFLKVQELADQFGVKVSDSILESVSKKLRDMGNYIPKVGFFGKTGAGKSTLCNAIFGAETCKVSDTGSCTRDIEELCVTVNGKKIVLIDVPGIGEDQSRDSEYFELYNSLMDKLDIIIWVHKADDRAFTDVQNAYEKVFKPWYEKHPKAKIPFIFALNQVDKVEPTTTVVNGQEVLSWDSVNRCPSAEQTRNIEEIIDNVKNKLPIEKISIVAVSAQRKYHLFMLIREMIRDLPLSKVSALSVVEYANPDLRPDENAENEEVKEKDEETEETKEAIKAKRIEAVKEVVVKVFNIAKTTVEKVAEGTKKVFSWLAKTFF